MPSPFPGMDPYLEAPTRWTDLHHRLISGIADTLQAQIRPQYYARIGERVYVITPPHALYPDVMLVEHKLREPTATYTRSRAPVGADDAPLIITLPPAEQREAFVEIVHAAGDEVVTVIEVLSPANKTPGEGRDLYLRKQRDLLQSQAHLVEIDLLSIGPHTVACPETGIGLPPATRRYLICVHRASVRFQYELYPVSLQQHLPHVRTPLRAPDADAVLDLPMIFTQCYDNGGYGDLIDYGRPPSAGLSAEEAAWTDGLLKGKGLRST